MNKEVILNTANGANFLVDDSELNSIAHALLPTIRQLLMAADGISNPDVRSIRTAQRLGYGVKIFHESEVGEFTRQYFDLAIDWCRQKNLADLAKSPEEDLYQLTFRKAESDWRFAKAYGNGSISHTQYVRALRTFLTLLLQGMWSNRAMLLPGDLNMEWNEFLLENSELSRPLHTDITWMLRRSRNDHSFESQVVDRISNPTVKLLNASLSTQFVQASMFFCSSDVSLEKMIEADLLLKKSQREGKGGAYCAFSSGVSMPHLVELLVEQFPDLGFTVDEWGRERNKQYHKNRHAASVKSRLRNRTNGCAEDIENLVSQASIKVGGRHLSTVLSALWPEDVNPETSEDAFKVIAGLSNRSQFSPKYLVDYLKAIEADDILISFADDLVKIQIAFLDHKQYINSNSFRTAFAILNSYLFHYIPLWFFDHPDSELKQPTQLIDIAGAIYLTRPIEPKFPVPKTLMDLLTLSATLQRSDRNTKKKWVYDLKQFFDHVIEFQDLYGDVIDGVKGFKATFLDTDVPKGKRERKSAKATFPSKHFKVLLRYVRALLDIQDQLVGKLESGEITWSDISAKRLLHLDELPVTDTYVEHFGRSCQVKTIPNLFRGIDVNQHAGFNGTTIYPGLLRHNYLMLETGIRGKQLRWLDESTFDQYVTSEQDNEYVQTLWVNTNKDGFPWPAVVVNRVIQCLRDQRDWKNGVECDGFNKSVHFSEENPDAYDPIFPIFSFNTDDGRPFSGEDYSDSWKNVLLGFQWFLHQHGISDEYYLKYFPVGFGKTKLQQYWDTTAPHIQKQLVQAAQVKLTEQGNEYCPVSLRVLVTPHGARVTVVSENVTVLPLEYVGENITGQFSRQTVQYYNLPDRDRVALLQKHQSQMMESGQVLPTENVDPSNPLWMEGRRMNDLIASSAAQDPESLAGEGSLLSVKMCLDKKQPLDGLQLIMSGKARRLSKQPSHICVFNDICPRELVELWGQTKLCGVCSYAVNHIAHLPAISAQRDKSWEEYESDREYYQTFSKRTDISDDEKQQMEEALLWRSYDALGWEIRERALRKKAHMISKGDAVSPLLVERPEEVASYIDARHIKDDETRYLLKRLGDCIAFPLTDSRTIKAKMSLASRRLLIATGRVDEALAERSESTAVADLYSLIESLRDMTGMTHAEIIGLMRSDPVALSDQFSKSRPMLPAE